VPLDRFPPLNLNERKVIARRCAFELPMGGVVNLGASAPSRSASSVPCSAVPLRTG
jgi:propionate CoA-transferase